ncbi:MAG: amidophosphoribosyltransferase [Patescibacteria group bacterium]
MKRDIWREECAVMAVSLPSELNYAPQFIYEGLRQQQHRGQDGSGMALVCPEGTVLKKELGLVSQVFPPDWLESHPSGVGIGHNRYSTQGLNTEVNLQPHQAGEIYLANNGHIINYWSLRNQLEREGEIFKSTNDGELLAKIVGREFDRTADVLSAIESLHQIVIGAYSVVMLFAGKLYVFRDPKGYRPLSLCRLPKGGVAVASETIAFDILEADFETYQEVLAGAVLEIDKGEVTVLKQGWPATCQCVFEHIYFSRPDSDVFGLGVALIRQRIGYQLALEFLAKSGFQIDDRVVVICVPDSSTQIARGAALALGAPYEQGLIRSHTARRTFIESQQQVRDEGVKYKFNPQRTVIKGKKVIVVDDSIVRGSTNKKLIAMLRRAGASEVYLLIGSPQIKWSCFMGIDTPTLTELIANQMDLSGIVKQLDVDSLTHLSLEGLKKAVGPITEGEKEAFKGLLMCLREAEAGSYYGRIWERLLTSDPEHFCYACFSGEYHLPVPLPNATIISEKFEEQ